MDTLHAQKFLILNELGELCKVLRQAAGAPVAILECNVVVAYLVPVEAVGCVHRATPSDRDLAEILANRRVAIQPVLDYLQEK